MWRSSATRIVLVEDMSIEAKIIERTLADVGYTNIAVVANENDALAEVEKGARVVLTDIDLGTGSGISLVNKVRGKDIGHYVYIIAMTGSSVAKRFAESFEAGVDDFIAKPVGGGELRSRMRAAERIVALETELRIKVVELETALRRIDVHAAQRALSRAQSAFTTPPPSQNARPIDALVISHPWGDSETALARAVTDFLQLPCEPCDAFEEDSYATEIELAEPTKELKVLCNVSGSEKLVRALSSHLMGEDDFESGKSLVLELANVLMGSLKTSWLGHGFHFIGGLPYELPAESLRSAFPGTPRRRRIALRFPDGGVLGVWLRAFETSSRMVATRDLVEGMVLTEDLHNEKGMLLVKGGTRLTQTAAERLARFAPDLMVSVISRQAADLRAAS